MLRALVRRAAKLEQKRPSEFLRQASEETSEFLRQASEEKAKQVICEHERARLKRLLAELPPGSNLTDEEAARLGDEIRHEVSSASEPRPASSGRSGARTRRRRAT